MKKFTKIGAIITSIVFIGVVFSLVFNLYSNESTNVSSTTTFLTVLSATLMVLLLGFTMFSYLEMGFGLFNKTADKPSNLADMLDKRVLKNKISSIEETLENIKKESLPKEAIDKFIKNILENEATSIVEERIKREFKDELIKERSYEIIEDELSELERNISIYIRKLSRDGSINLVIGGLTTLIALIGLSVFMFESQVDFENTNKLLSHYIPRISIVIFIEIFSFFFLKLYRNTLEDVKYFENERTNINSKKAALKFAYLTENKEVINEILLDLSKTERNFKLAKDETTVTLEKVKLENAQSSTNLQTLMSLLKIKDKDKEE